MRLDVAASAIKYGAAAAKEAAVETYSLSVSTHGLAMTFTKLQGVTYHCRNSKD